MYTCKMGPNWFLYKRLQLYPTIAKIHTPPFMNSKNTQKQDKKTKQNKTKTKTKQDAQIDFGRDKQSTLVTYANTISKSS